MEKLFRKFGIITIIAVIVLIFVGGLVRATGSGMGCPDWPKCFGMWVPPTSIDQLPHNYQEIFGAKLHGEVIFNPLKTWIEYCNRLVGVSIGIFIFITFILSIRAYIQTHKEIVWICFLAWILVAFEGWLGAKVVYSELHPLMITIHMLVSIIILGLLIWAVLKSASIKIEMHNYGGVLFLIGISVFISLGQILFGTQIREGVDIVQKEMGEENRGIWLEALKGKVIFHAVIATVLLGLNFYINAKLKNAESILKNWGKSLWLITLFSFITGLVLALLKMPAVAQPFHLTSGILIISNLFVLFFILKTGSKVG